MHAAKSTTKTDINIEHDEIIATDMMSEIVNLHCMPCQRNKLQNNEWQDKLLHGLKINLLGQFKHISSTEHNNAINYVNLLDHGHVLIANNVHFNGYVQVGFQADQCNGWIHAS